jgi:hypothetical protein
MTMRDTRYLLFALAMPVVILTALWFALALSVGFLAFGASRPPASPTTIQAVALTIIMFAPVAVGAYWIFRKLRSRWQRREALAVAISFAVFSPLSLVAAIPLAVIPGGYASYLGRPFGLVGSLLSIVLMLWLANFLPSLFILWLLRRLRPPDLGN